jgi:adenylate cyclase
VCGSPVAASTPSAEYKQVTVLFADVVRSMNIASALDPERLRAIMTAIFNQSSVIVRRYGGTVDKFTGDGIMAIFGAPVALEDHAFRACLAALDIQHEMIQLAEEAHDRDGVELRLRVGLNSGQVIAGEIDSGPGGYTAIGVQVGMAQRMESVAPPGGIVLSESTARLVSHIAMLGEPEAVGIKGADAPVTAYRLLGTGDPGRHRRHETTLVGRGWELAALTGVLENAIGGSGVMVGVCGAPGIGKSRVVSELTDEAAHRGTEVFATYCEAHARDIPFHAVARLLRAVFGVNGVDAATARARLRARLDAGAPEDLSLLDDLLGIRDPATPAPEIEPDARRRRLTGLINTASLARTTPTLYVIEDAHWIDEVSDSMLADFISVIPQTPSLVITTYRPEYQGALTRIPRSQTITLAPLDDSQTRSLTVELLGQDPSLDGLAARIVGRAAGNPFFVEEIVRDLAERGVIAGSRGAYLAHGDVVDLAVPSTLQAVITARVDRLNATAKRSLSAAAAIGSRFSADLLARLVEDTDLCSLVDADLIDQVMFTPHAEYAFRHPLIRTVAYESQLKSSRADLHRRLATTIENDEPDAVEENAAVIAEHLQAAGDLAVAFGWHMRAAAWSQSRDFTAAKTSWLRAREAADRVHSDNPNRLQMRIAPRTMLCANSWRVGGSVEDAGFDELRELTGVAGDKVSLAIGMLGWLTALTFNDRIAESARMAGEYVALVESIGQPSMTVGLSAGALQATLQAGAAVESFTLAQRVIELADGDTTMGNLVFGSPLGFALAAHGFAAAMLGMPGVSDTFEAAVTAARPADAASFAAVATYKHVCITLGAIPLDDAAVQEAEEVFDAAEHSGDQFAYSCALLTRGMAFLNRGGEHTAVACEMLTRARESALSLHSTIVRVADIHLAAHQLRTGDLDGAVELVRTIIDDLTDAGDGMYRGKATGVLVEALLLRRLEADIDEARTAIERLEAIPVDPGYVLHEIPLLRMRALLARATGDEAGYRDYADRYRIRSTECRYAGHMAIAEAMA